MNWIIGDLAASRICELTDLFFSRKLKAACEKHDRAFSRYEPWMGTGTNDYSQDLQFKDTSRFCFDSESIVRFERHFLQKNIPILDVKGEPRRVFLFPEFSSKYPAGPGQFLSAWEFLLQSSPWIRLIAEKLVVRILPVRGAVYDWGSSVSSHLLPGLIFMGLVKPESQFEKIDYAIGFAHEIGHQSLILYQNADPILNGDQLRPVYSGIRKTQRPAIMALHAAVALGFMIDTARRLLLSSQEQAEREHIAQSLDSYVTSLRSSLLDMKQLNPTAVGRKIIDELGVIASQ